MAVTDKEKTFLLDAYEKYCNFIEQDSSLLGSGADKLPPRNNYFICQDHSTPNNQWSDQVNGQCSSCVKYSAVDKIDGGLLFTGKDVLSRLITMRAKNAGISGNSEYECATELFCHWVHCNVYPITIQAITVRIKALHKAYTDIKRYDSKKKTDGFWKKYATFVKNQHSLFDIRDSISSDSVHESIWGVKMTDKDKAFYEDQQKGPRKQYCTRVVDSRWRKSHERKIKRMDRSRNETYDSFTGVSVEDDYEEEDESLPEPEPMDTLPNTVATEGVKRNYQYSNVEDDILDDLPEEYRHIRYPSGKRKSSSDNVGQRSVRPEIYKVMGILSSKYHMSQTQVEGSIVVIANEVFGRKKYGEWKVFNRKIAQDNNTLPAMSNTRRTESYIEAMALSMIVDEMMRDEPTTTIVWSNDGSGMSKVGKYVVQSLNINGVKRNLPTAGIFTESRESLTELMKDTCRILSAASGGKYSDKEIFERISFVMTDSTSHNLKVVEKVSEDLNSTNIPATILCNIHPLMMFQSKIKNLCQMLHDSLGSDKISNCFMVDIEFRNESFIIKAITCLSNFISHEYSAKPWNRYSHFTEFISPKKNMSISLKDHRFNRLMDCSLSLLFHFEDIASYLEKFTSINNGITVLDRSFVDMDILKPIFAAISLLGLHITRPFQTLLTDKETNYSTLLQAFPILFKNLTEIKASDYLTIEQVVTFVSPAMFKDSLPDENLLKMLSSTLPTYPVEISRFLGVALKMFADGFSLQKGAIFGFGPDAEAETGTVLKLCSLSRDEINKMDNAKVQVHNLAEENTVGCVNYELGIRGKSNLESVSRKIILNKSNDLLQNCDAASIKSYRERSVEIKKIKAEWNEKMKELERKGFSEKEILNITRDEKKLTDLDVLKSSEPPGPFSKTEEVKNYIDDPNIDDKTKNERLYVEVRYARKTSLSLKESAPVFRLKSNHKNLSSQEYAANLMQYLDNARNVGSISVTDLNSALLVLNGTQADGTDSPTDGKEGEHVAILDFDQNSESYRWVLGIIHRVENEKTLSVALMISGDGGVRWTFPNEAEIKSIERNNVICWNMAVAYCQTARISCKVDEKLVNELNLKVNTFNNDQT